MKRTTRNAIAPTLAAVFAVILPPAWADTIDQSFIDPSSSSAAFYPGFQLAQTFTAGMTGTLTGVNLIFSVTLVNGSEPGALDVSVRTVDGVGAPTSTILGSTTITATVAHTYFSLSDFIAFPSAIPSLAGTQYAIVVTPLTVYNGLWYGYHVDSYAGGRQWANAGGSWYHYEDPSDSPPRSWDLNFRTYVDPVPEPGTLILVAMGLGGLLLIKRKKAA